MPTKSKGTGEGEGGGLIKEIKTRAKGGRHLPQTRKQQRTQAKVSTKQYETT
jgi:hypothetical protein